MGFHIFFRSIGPASAALIAAWAAAVPFSAQGQTTPDATLPEMVVTATRLPTPLEQVASSVTVITADDIARNNYRTLPEALRTVPGVDVVSLGPSGAATGVFVRGTESNHTLVLLDGIEINDPSTADGQFDFANIMLEDVERIEFLRGSQSTLYGSDAIGGVVNIITKRGRGPARFSARLEGGTDSTLNQAASVSGAYEKVDYRLSVERLDTEGQSVTPKRNRPDGVNSEKDGFENLSLAASGGVQITETVRANVVARYIDSEVELDPSPEDPNADQESDQFFGRAEVEATLFDGFFDNRLGVGYTDYDRRFNNPADGLSADFANSTFEGRKLKFDWQGDLYLTETQTLTLGAETEKEDSDSRSSFSSGFRSRTNNDVRTSAGFAQLQSSFFDRLFSTLGLRIDAHDRFGKEVTGRVAVTYLHRETDTKLKASYGNGFKAPSLEQLFGASFFDPFGQVFSGNPDLNPERSHAVEAGIEQTLWQDRLTLGGTFFYIEIDDLISFNDTFTTLVNVDEAKIRGIEAFVAVRPLPALGLRVDYTFTETEDEETGDNLLRRPRHKASVSADLQATENIDLAVNVIYTGGRLDIDSNTFATVSTTDYALVNVSGSYRLGETWRFFARIENLFDENYEPADGFKGPGISALAGVRATF